MGQVIKIEKIDDWIEQLKFKMLKKFGISASSTINKIIDEEWRELKK